MPGKETYRNLYSYMDSQLVELAVSQFEKRRQQQTENYSTSNQEKLIDQLKNKGDSAASTLSKKIKKRIGNMIAINPELLEKYDESEHTEIDLYYRNLLRRRRTSQTGLVNKLYKKGHITSHDVNMDDGKFKMHWLAHSEFFQREENLPLLSVLANYEVSKRSKLGKEAVQNNSAEVPIPTSYHPHPEPLKIVGQEEPKNVIDFLLKKIGRSRRLGLSIAGVVSLAMGASATGANSENAKSLFTNNKPAVVSGSNYSPPHINTPIPNVSETPYSNNIPNIPSPTPTPESIALITSKTSYRPDSTPAIDPVANCFPADLGGHFVYSGDHVSPPHVIGFFDNTGANKECNDTIYFQVYGSAQTHPGGPDWSTSKHLITSRPVIVRDKKTDVKVSVNVPQNPAYCTFEVDALRREQRQDPPVISDDQRIDYVYVDNTAACNHSTTPYVQSKKEESPLPKTGGIPVESSKMAALGLGLISLGGVWKRRLLKR